MEYEKAVQNIVGAGINALLNDDGFTISPDTGKSYTGDWWTVGGIIPSLILNNGMDAADFADAVAEWYEGAKALDIPYPLVGGWVHEGSLYIDYITIVRDEEKAKLLGRLWSQIAIARRIGDDEEFMVVPV